MQIEVEQKAGTSGYTDRIQTLRNQVLDAQSTICLERARCYTHVYREHADKPVLLKRALALEKTLGEMTIFIEDGGLIVGNQSSKLRAAPIFPEYAVEWIVREIDEFEKRPGDQFYPSREVKDELVGLCEFWKGSTTLDRGRALMAPRLRAIHNSNIIRAEGNLTSGDAHIAIDDKRVLAEGLGAYITRVESARETCDPTTRDGVTKRTFYDALTISLNAFAQFIMRYSELAASLASAESNPVRTAELERIARVCRHISRSAPRDFYEALQLTYFVQLVLQIESNGHSMSLGRMDQYLYPFYRRDRDAGALTDEFAMELLENTWIKLLSIHKIRSWSHTRFSAGSPLYQNVTIGGQTRDGLDAVNDLSYLILRSVGETKLTQPNLSVRYHAGMDDEFLRACLEVIAKGFGMPAFNNDDVVIPSLLDLGVETEDARDYSAIGCIEIAVPGKWGYRATGKHFLNFMRVLLAALHGGLDTSSGETFFPGEGTLATFESFDDVMNAWDHQVREYCRAGVGIDTAIDLVLEADAPDLLCSAFVDDCIDRGLTIHEGGSKYDFVSGLQVGIANLGNSLAAIRKLVFEEKRISGEDLLRHLSENFEGSGGEAVRQQLLNLAPKYGNDDDYVDQLLVQAYGSYIDEIRHYRTIRDGHGPIGCRYFAGTSSISGNVPGGAVVPATPDGRKAGLPLAEGSSPSGGTDTEGPTAVFRSVSKLPADKITGGVLLNQKVSPSVIAEEMSKTKLVHLLRSFFTDLKGWHVQYNVVDRETLIDAQEHPEDHRDLVVRVAGYSAFFTTLSPDTQNDIIGRTEQAL